MNTDLLWEIAQEIDAYPKRYDQGTYYEGGDCGTKHCIAGWAIKLQVPQVYALLMASEDPKLSSLNTAKLQKAATNLFEATTGLDTSNRNHAALWDDCVWFNFARRLLDLSAKDAVLLFHGWGKPRHKLTPAQALEKIATGVPIKEVWKS